MRTQGTSLDSSALLRPGSGSVTWDGDHSVRLVAPTAADLRGALEQILRLSGHAPGEARRLAARHSPTMGLLGHYGSGSFCGCCYAFVVDAGVLRMRLWPRPGAEVLAGALGSLIDGPGSAQKGVA